MIRDPFNIHERNVFKATAFRPAPNTEEKAAHAGANALDMSFSMPKNVPSFNNPQRDLEDRFWGSGASSNQRGGLPMYKDKPYAQSPDRPIWRRKRAVGTVTFVVLTLLYFMGFFSRDGYDKRVNTDWSWMNESQEKGKADWSKRRERVVEAFQISWDAYERYAWGTLSSWRSWDLY